MHGVLAFLAGYFLTILTPGPNMIMIASKSMVDGRRSTRPLIIGLCFGTLALYAALRLVGAAISSWIDLRHAGPLASGAALMFVAYAVAYAVAPIHRRAPIDANAVPVRQDMDALGVTFGMSTAFFNPITASYFVSQLLHENASVLDAASTAATFFGLLILCASKHLIVASVFSAPRWRAAALRHELLVRLVLCSVLAGYAGWTAAPQLAVFGGASNGRLGAAVATGLAALALSAALRFARPAPTPRRPLRRSASHFR